RRRPRDRLAPRSGHRHLLPPDRRRRMIPLLPLVSFVSSGPGDPELLTVKAVKRLQSADVVLYDDLSAGPLLELARPEADLISVGKRAGRASPRQDHVSRLLVDQAQS